MAKSTFTYVSYIRASREAVFAALTDSKTMRQYWFGMHQEAEWKPGGSWKLVFPDGQTADAGEVLEYDPPSRLALRWRNEFRPEIKAEGYSRCEMTLETQGDAVKLTILHSIDRENAKFIESVSGGWPQVVSNLKSLLETGKVAFERTYPSAQTVSA